MPTKPRPTSCSVYDVIIPAERYTVDDVIKLFGQLAKKWVFQLEQGHESGYLHYQCRVSLFKKRRPGEAKTFFNEAIPGCHCSPTVTEEHKKTAFYVMKLDTRIEGPWTNEDVVLFVPRQYASLETRLLPFQQTIWDSADIFDPRTINLIVDVAGNAGKSTIASLMDLHKRGIDLPPFNDAEKLIQATCDILMSRELRQPKTVFIDLPRAMDKRRLGGLFTAIEQIKKGHVFDTRYQYKDWWFDAPQIWVFSNFKPDLEMLSADRWRLWKIIDHELHPFNGVQDDSLQFPPEAPMDPLAPEDPAGSEVAPMAPMG